MLKRKAGLNDRLSREISHRYRTWQAFLDADADDVARQVGMLPGIVEAIKEALTAADA